MRNYTVLTTLLLLFSFNGIWPQQPLTDKILIEFMKPEDKDAEAKGVSLKKYLGNILLEQANAINAALNNPSPSSDP